ncbi:MAG TPA: S53 family peptidase [Terriglobia bacterium]|nr:S53 family peptidase [Terriglobia bacterium]
MSDRKVFTDSVIPLPEAIGLTPNGLMLQSAEPESGKESMTLLFSLAIPEAAKNELEERVAAGQVVPQVELQNKYTPSESDAKTLRSWLESQGFKIQSTSSDRTSIYARGTIEQIEKSLGVQMVRVIKDGLSYMAARNAPSLPADVGGSVHAIIGLQPYRKARKHSIRRMPRRGHRAPGSPAPAAAGPAPNIQNAPPYLVPEVLKAYDADSLPVTGKNQIIAILIDTVPNDTDLTSFWRQNGVAASLAQIEKVNVTGAPLPPPEGEETLDVEWASGIAPGATIRIYATSSLEFVDLDLALDRIIQDVATMPNLRQLSISLGLGETFLGGPQGEVATQHQKFLRLAAAGVNVFVSSGDAGSNPDQTGHSPTGPTQAEYESSDPFVIGVGGTSLSLAANGAVASETAWTGSGGGRSIFFTRPTWQKGAGVPAGTQRLVPDVSVTADPDKGAFLVLQDKEIQIGGTSWSAPIWAAFCALINEARIAAGKSALPFLNPLIYPLANSRCFRDIQNGSNGAFHAGAGYDMVTGIGVPNVKALISDLP